MTTAARADGPRKVCLFELIGQRLPEGAEAPGVTVDTIRFGASSVRPDLLRAGKGPWHTTARVPHRPDWRMGH